ncbi:hypothetical protein FVN59_00905 [Campylobacter coli]|nr:hypothetical protein [Campylobacter coli]
MSQKYDILFFFCDILFFRRQFIKNKNLKKIHSSLKNATIMVELDTSCVILRSDEAKTIEVNLI